MDEAGTISRFRRAHRRRGYRRHGDPRRHARSRKRFDEVVEQVNNPPRVAHNYEREHPHLNVWFVVSVADEDRVDEVLGDIESETGQETYNLPKQQEFRVEAKFPVEGPLKDLPDGLDLSDLGPDVSPRTVVD